MERPVWTLCFLTWWLLLAAGTVFTHLVFVTLVPELQEFPANLDKGFQEEFKFAYLDKDSTAVRDAAAAAISAASCGGQREHYDVVNVASCSLPSQELSIALANFTGGSTCSQKQELASAFDRSLSVVQRIGNDKYLGRPAFHEVAVDLDNIMDLVNEIDCQNSSCQVAVPLYCGIYTSGIRINGELGAVRKQIDEFASGMYVETINTYAAYLPFVHGLPYLLMLSMCFFSCFWYLSGRCCCCQGGSLKVCLLLLPCAILWLIFFLIIQAIVVLGVALTWFQDRIPTVGLNGNPNLAEVVEHLKVSFPGFWNIVFTDLLVALEKWFRVSLGLDAVCLAFVLYSICLCCARPYSVRDSLPAKEAPAADLDEQKDDALDLSWKDAGESDDDDIPVI